MQLLQLLTEQADRQQEVVELIHAIRQAKPFFDQRGDDPGAWLYRGINSREVPTGLVEVRSPRNDRQPLDTAPTIHNMLDAKLFQEFGVKYRSTSTFVTGDLLFAADYGKLCVVLPLGSFKYVYAKNMKDAYDYFSAYDLKNAILSSPSVAPEYKDEIKDMPADSRWSQREIIRVVDHTPALHKFRDDWFEERYKACNYISPVNITEGLLSGHEIMLHCEQLAIIPYTPTVHPDTIALIERQLNARFDLGMEQYPSIKQLINLILPYIFK